MILALMLAASTAVLPSVQDVVRVIGSHGFAHACPISGGRLITNRHVIDEMSSVRWSDASGNEGTAVVESESQTADLAVLRITVGRTPVEFTLAKNPPQPGTRVVLRGYRYDGKRNVMAERRVETRVTRVEAGHFLYEASGFRGSSGSCVLNEAGEVLGINAWSIPTEASNEAVGLAVGVWGEWVRELDVDTVK